MKEDQISDWKTGQVGILGSGSWATALAKILLESQENIGWYFRFKETVKKFKSLGHNPSYLSSIRFDTSRIKFYTDVNEIIRASDTLILVTPSPYVKHLLGKMKKTELRGKFFLNAVKGIVPEDNVLITSYLTEKFGVPEILLGAIGGPCHAEEVAMERLSYLTVASNDEGKAEALKKLFTASYVNCRCSTDVTGIELAAVLKNVYAIASGICYGMQYGDNFQAVLVSNAVQEMKRFLDMVHFQRRNISDSVYLGDLLVTAYSRFSRNRTFGTLIGKGLSVKQAQLQMEMVAEGYYGAKCIHELNKNYKTSMPITEAIYRILYKKDQPTETIKRLMHEFR